MLRLAALLLLALAARPAAAQAVSPPFADSPGRNYVSSTPADAVVAAWSEALSTLDGLAQSLDAYPETPAEQQAEARRSIALTAASTAGGIVEATRFAVAIAGVEATREASVAVFQNGLALAYVVGGIASEASGDTDDGAEPGWHAHAALIRQQVGQTRAALAGIGVTPR